MLLQAFKKISAFLKSLGVKAVFDTSFSRDLSLIEACEEFVAKYSLSNDKSESSLPILASACPGANNTVSCFLLLHALVTLPFQLTYSVYGK